MTVTCNKRGKVDINRRELERKKKGIEKKKIHVINSVKEKVKETLKRK